MDIIYRDIEDLQPFEGNPREQTRRVLRDLMRSITKFGFVEPVIVWKNAPDFGYPAGTVLGGHRRLDAVKQLVADEGYDGSKIPCVEVGVNSVAAAKALNIALNKISEDFDPIKLRDWFLDIRNEGLDLEMTGFLPAEAEYIFEYDVKEVGNLDYDTRGLEKLICPKCGHEWYR